MYFKCWSRKLNSSWAWWVVPIIQVLGGRGVRTKSSRSVSTTIEFRAVWVAWDPILRQIMRLLSGNRERQHIHNTWISMMSKMIKKRGCRNGSVVRNTWMRLAASSYVWWLTAACNLRFQGFDAAVLTHNITMWTHICTSLKINFRNY